MARRAAHPTSRQPAAPSRNRWRPTHPAHRPRPVAVPDPRRRRLGPVRDVAIHLAGARIQRTGRLPDPVLSRASIRQHEHIGPLAVAGAYQIGERFNSPSDTSRPAPADRVSRTSGLSLVLSHPSVPAAVPLGRRDGLAAGDRRAAFLSFWQEIRHLAVAWMGGLIGARICLFCMRPDFGRRPGNQRETQVGRLRAWIRVGRWTRDRGPVSFGVTR